MGTIMKVEKRRMEIAYLYFEGYTPEEIASDAEISVRTVERDIKYIKEHIEEFLS